VARIWPAAALEDRTAVITGGATGIGEAVAASLANAGAAVFVGGRR
jgi:NAD(P)-dependent dehydrogenase (short-subunit alcohol dehydrogenase family)